MEYLFYDIESSNGNCHEASLCSFGYVITDDHFNVIEKNDLLVNPVTEFTEEVLLDVGLAYSENEFRKSPTFDCIYNLVKKLFEKVDKVFGFSIDSDINYLNSAIKHFELEKIEYSFIDIQEMMMMRLRKLQFRPGLRRIASDYGIEYGEHKSSEDAEATMLILKSVLDERKLDLSSVMKRLDIDLSFEIDIDKYNIPNHSHTPFKELLKAYLQFAD